MNLILPKYFTLYIIYKNFLRPPEESKTTQLRVAIPRSKTTALMDTECKTLYATFLKPPKDTVLMQLLQFCVQSLIGNKETCSLRKFSLNNFHQVEKQGVYKEPH